MQLKLDRPVIKALSNDTRVSILKALKSRRHTQSELASYLDLSVPTVKEHLAALEKAALVERHDEGRKWKYYSLTRTAKHIFEPEQVNIFLVLGIFILSVAGSVYAYFGRFVDVSPRPAMLAESVGTAESMDVVATAAVPPGPSFISQYGYLFFGFVAAAALVLLGFFLYRRIKKKELLGKYLTKE